MVTQSIRLLLCRPCVDPVYVSKTSSSQIQHDEACFRDFWGVLVRACLEIIIVECTFPLRFARLRPPLLCLRLRPPAAGDGLPREGASPVSASSLEADSGVLA